MSEELKRALVILELGFRKNFGRCAVVKMMLLVMIVAIKIIMVEMLLVMMVVIKMIMVKMLPMMFPITSIVFVSKGGEEHSRA